MDHTATGRSPASNSWLIAGAPDRSPSSSQNSRGSQWGTTRAPLMLPQSRPARSDVAQAQRSEVRDSVRQRFDDVFQVNENCDLLGEGGGAGAQSIILSSGWLCGVFQNAILPPIGPPWVGFGRYFGVRKPVPGGTFWACSRPLGGPKKSRKNMF